MAVIVLLSLVLVGGTVSGTYFWNVANAYTTKAQVIPQAFPAAQTRPVKPATASGSMNILLLGSDADGGSGGQENLDGVPNGSRSDTMMLVHIPKDRQNVYVMSIMRDTWTDIPGFGEHKINAALSFGGVPLVVQTVESLFKVPIDHVAIVNFAGFKSLTTALGGVDLNNPVAFTSKDRASAPAEYFAAGPIHLEGASALKYVRERYAFADGDYQRVRNQQLFLKAVMTKLLSTKTATDPGKNDDIVNLMSPYLTVDKSLDALAVGTLRFELRSLRGKDVHVFTLPNLGTGTSADGQSIVLKDDASIAKISAALADDSLGDYLTAAGLVK